MRQAQTLNDAQLRRVIQYCRSRRHPVRDETIILISFYAGLRAKEIAALTVGNVFDEAGAVRTQFILSAEQGRACTHCLSQSAFAEDTWRLWRDQILGRPTAPAVRQSKGRALLGQHHVSAVLGHLQSRWAQGCLKPFGKAHLHYQIGQQGRRGAIAGGTGGAFAYIHDPERHRREFRTAERSGGVTLADNLG